MDRVAGVDGVVRNRCLKIFLVSGVAAEKGHDVVAEFRQTLHHDRPIRGIGDDIVLVPQTVADSPNAAPVMAGQNFLGNRADFDRSFGYA